MRKYPDWTDFDIQKIHYGVGAPFVGIGIYTQDLEFSWPDREGTMKREYEAWVKHLTAHDYEIPEKYLNAYVEEKLDTKDVLDSTKCL